MSLSTVSNDDLAIAISEYIKNQNVTDGDSVNIELIKSGDMSGFRFANIEAPTVEQLLALVPSAQVISNQMATNAEDLKFLADSDYKVIKYRDQVAMGRVTDLSAEEYQSLLEQRQQARDRIN